MGNSGDGSWGLCGDYYADICGAVGIFDFQDAHHTRAYRQNEQIVARADGRAETDSAKHLGAKGRVAVA